MQRKRSRIRQRVAANDSMNIFARDRFKKRRVKTAPNAAPDRVMTAINRSLNARLIRRFIAKSHGSRITHHNAVVFRHQQTMTASSRELLKPRHTRLHRMRREIKCDRRMDYVVVVNLGEQRKVASNSRTNANVVHNGW